MTIDELIQRLENLQKDHAERMDSMREESMRIERQFAREITMLTLEIESKRTQPRF